MADKRYAVATSEDMPNGDTRYHTEPIDHDHAVLILVHNGWTEAQAEADLAECPDRWISVNSCTQLC